MLLDLSTPIILLISTFIIFIVFTRKNSKISKNFPRSYPLIGMAPSIFANQERICQWTSDVLQNTATGTYVFESVFGRKQILTANPLNVQHMLKTEFNMYPKGNMFTSSVADLLGDGIFNADGDTWKFQRQVASHEFNTKSLRKFVQTVVEIELSDRLIPILSAAAVNGTVLDFQDILQRFAFDNICKIAFGYDPEYLTPSLPKERFATAFEDSVRLTSERSKVMIPIIWKIKRFFAIGSEKDLKKSVLEVREFAKSIVRKKKLALKNESMIDSDDLLSRFLSSGHSDEDFVTDIVISFIIAGRDTTSAALTWFFWLLSKNSEVENEILKEIGEKSESMAFDEIKDMPYTHAALCESMRFYPPVPMDSKTAGEDNVLPDGTFVKKGMVATYHPYAMGRSEKLWGADWSEFRPERWLEKDQGNGNIVKWKFVPKDPYTYPVFQAGPRICLGKEMAFLQMKKVVAGVMRGFRVVPVVAEDGTDPVFMTYLTAKMKDGFPVKIEERRINTDNV